MARESQGLQVLLIVFVMLSVVLGVTTYIYNKRADEATKAVVAANAAKQQAENDKSVVEKERDDLKKWVGFPERNTEEIHKQFDDDMQTFGNEKKSDAGTEKAAADKPALDASAVSYHNLVEAMNKVIQDRNFQVTQARNQYNILDGQYKNREAAKDKAIDTYTASFTNLDAESKKNFTAFSEGLLATQAESTRTLATVAGIKKAADEEKSKAEDSTKAAAKAIQLKEEEIRKLAELREKLNRPEMDVPSGEITWVSLPNKLVWINRGRADALQRQTRFTVYSGDSTSAAKAVKKGTVEVTQIEGDHSAQCRIIDDKLADPIMAGDKVFTPLWSPGQQNHFAVTGIMNLDGDGRNQFNVVRGLINNHGGEVDCWLDEHGKKQGQVTANTRYVVVGDAPDKSSPEFMKNHGDILRDAERYHIPTMKLADFKQQMGYQKSSSVEHFGPSAPSDLGRTPTGPKAPKAAPPAAPKSEDTGT